MFTAMLEYHDDYRKPYFRNAKLGTYKSSRTALRIILKKSPSRSGMIFIGQRLVSIVRNGIETQIPNFPVF